MPLIGLNLPANVGQIAAAQGLAQEVEASAPNRFFSQIGGAISDGLSGIIRRSAEVGQEAVAAIITANALNGRNVREAQIATTSPITPQQTPVQAPVPAQSEPGLNLSNLRSPQTLLLAGGALLLAVVATR